MTTILFFSESELANSQAMAVELRQNLERTIEENHRLKTELAKARDASDSSTVSGLQKKLLQELAASVDYFFGILPKPVRDVFRRILIDLKEDGLRILQLTRRYIDALAGMVVHNIRADRDRFGQGDLDRSNDNADGRIADL